MATSLNLPPRHVLDDELHRYSIYNYYGFPPIAWARVRRLRRALSLASSHFEGSVIDMGCGDGILLPSLSAWFDRALAIDCDSHHIAATRQLIDQMLLTNVRSMCNQGLSWDAVRERAGGPFDCMLVLETMAHVGEPGERMWESKADFLHGCFSLLKPGGSIVISVPKMVGPMMLGKNLIQRSLRLGYDPMTWRQLLRSAFLYDTDELEPLWYGHHVGFNHLKLDKVLSDHFRVTIRKESLISVFYVIHSR